MNVKGVKEFAAAHELAFDNMDDLCNSKELREALVKDINVRGKKNKLLGFE